MSLPMWLEIVEEQQDRVIRALIETLREVGI